MKFKNVTFWSSEGVKLRNSFILKVSDWIRDDFIFLTKLFIIYCKSCMKFKNITYLGTDYDVIERLLKTKRVGWCDGKDLQDGKVDDVMKRLSYDWITQ